MTSRPFVTGPIGEALARRARRLGYVVLCVMAATLLAGFTDPAGTVWVVMAIEIASVSTGSVLFLLGVQMALGASWRHSMAAIPSVLASSQLWLIEPSVLTVLTFAYCCLVLLVCAAVRLIVLRSHVAARPPVEPGGDV